MQPYPSKIDSCQSVLNSWERITINTAIDSFEHFQNEEEYNKTPCLLKKMFVYRLYTLIFCVMLCDYSHIKQGNTFF
jgi:hypothetical protein